MTIMVTKGARLVPGHYFSIAGRLHLVTRVLDASGGAATVEFRPPLRATVADLEPVELIAPKAPMRLASDDTAAMELDLGRFATLQLDLVEAF